MAVPLIVAGGLALAKAGVQGTQAIKQKIAANKLKQKPVSAKTTEAEARARSKAGQTTDTIAEAEREQLEQGAANAVARTKDVGGSSVDQLQAVQATERQRQTGEQNIGIQQAGRKRQDESAMNVALANTALEEERNNLAFRNEKQSLLNASSQNAFNAISGIADVGMTAAAGGFSKENLPGAAAIGAEARATKAKEAAAIKNAPSAQGAGIAGVQTMGDFNGAPQLGQIQNTHQQAQNALNAANPMQKETYIPALSKSSLHSRTPMATNPLFQKYQNVNSF